MKPKMLATSTPPFKEWKSTRICKKTLDHFKALENQDPELFYKLKLDTDHIIECLFWVDGAARHAYIESYSDIVPFDATSMTNMYDMPFTLFIGINKHGQSFMLECAFIRYKKEPDRMLDHLGN